MPPMVIGARVHRVSAAAAFLTLLALATVGLKGGGRSPVALEAAGVPTAPSGAHGAAKPPVGSADAHPADVDPQLSVAKVAAPVLFRHGRVGIAWW